MKKVNKEISQTKLLLAKAQLAEIDNLINRLKTKVGMVEKRRANKASVIAGLEASIASIPVTE